MGISSNPGSSLPEWEEMLEGKEFETLDDLPDDLVTMNCDAQEQVNLVSWLWGLHEDEDAVFGCYPLTKNEMTSVWGFFHLVQENEADRVTSDWAIFNLGRKFEKYYKQE